MLFIVHVCYLESGFCIWESCHSLPFICFFQLLALVGDQLDDADNICGAVLSVRFNEDIISVWNRNASDHQVRTIRRSTLYPLVSFSLLLLWYLHSAMFSVNRQWWVWETRSSGIWSCLMHMSWNTSPTMLLFATTPPTETHGWEDRFNVDHCIMWRGEISGRSPATLGRYLNWALYPIPYCTEGLQFRKIRATSVSVVIQLFSCF